MAWNRLSRCDVDSAATVCFGEYRFNGVEPPESMRLFGKDSVQEEVMGCFNGVEPPESMRLLLKFLGVDEVVEFQWRGTA